MNKKQAIISIVFTEFFILTFSGCDWCGCCKKTVNVAPTHMQEPKTMVEHPKKTDAMQPHAAPMPIHPLEMPAHPIEPKIAPMPEAPAPKAA